MCQYQCENDNNLDCEIPEQRSKILAILQFMSMEFGDYEIQLNWKEYLELVYIKIDILHITQLDHVA